MTQTIFQALNEIEKNHQSAALCTVTKSEGSTPRHVGSKMLVYPDGNFIGTVGGGDLEHRVLDEAWMAISDGQSRLLHYNMADPSRGDPGVCGGQVEVFVEPILPPALLVVIGAGQHRNCLDVAGCRERGPRHNLIVRLIGQDGGIPVIEPEPDARVRHPLDGHANNPGLANFGIEAGQVLR